MDCPGDFDGFWRIPWVQRSMRRASLAGGKPLEKLFEAVRLEGKLKTGTVPGKRLAAASMVPPEERDAPKEEPPFPAAARTQQSSVSPPLITHT